MKIFKGFNNDGGDTCRICNTGIDKKTVVIPIVGTESGNSMIGMQLHLDCIDLLCQNSKDGSALLFQFIPAKDKNDNKINKISN